MLESRCRRLVERVHHRRHDIADGHVKDPWQVMVVAVQNLVFLLQASISAACGKLFL